MRVRTASTDGSSVITAWACGRPPPRPLPGGPSRNSTLGKVLFTPCPFTHRGPHASSCPGQSLLCTLGLYSALPTAASDLAFPGLPSPLRCHSPRRLWFLLSPTFPRPLLPLVPVFSLESDLSISPSPLLRESFIVSLKKAENVPQD